MTTGLPLETSLLGSISGRYYFAAAANDRDDGDAAVVNGRVWLIDATTDAAVTGTTTDADGDY